MQIQTPRSPNYQNASTVSENLQSSATVSSATITSRAIDGVGSPQKNDQHRRANVGDDDQQKRQQSSTLTAAQYDKIVAAHQENQTIYDKPSGSNRQAINSYQSVLNAPRREEIQRLVGIDTFA